MNEDLTRLPELARRKIVVVAGCWLWTGRRNRKGYGLTNKTMPGSALAHRAVYQLLVGPIPGELPLDHRCRRPRCVRPSHMEPLTHRENILRGDGIAARNAAKTHCEYGHEFTKANTYPQRGGKGRGCVTCRARRSREHRARRREGVSL